MSDSILTMEKLLESKRMLENLMRPNPQIALLDTRPVLSGDVIVMNPALAEHIKQATRNNEPTMGFSIPDMLYGMKIIEHAGLTKQKQTKFPRSKKRRIQKKFRKKYTITVPSNDVYVIDSKAILSGGLIPCW